MSCLRELVQDLRAHAPDAPAHCAALMRRSAREIERRIAAAALDQRALEDAR